MIADFRPGAGGNLAAELAAKSPADGYTLLLTSPSLVISPQPLQEAELRYAARLRASVAVVHCAQCVRDPSVGAGEKHQRLVKLAKAHPGKMSFGSGGVGSSNHLAGELFKSLAKVDILHVPYKGAMFTRMFQKRLKGYKAIGYSVQENQLATPGESI